MDALRALATASPVADHLASTGGGMAPLVAASRNRSRSASNGLGFCAPRGSAHGPAGKKPCQTTPGVATAGPRPSPTPVEAGLWHSKLGRAGFAAASFTSSVSTSSPGCTSTGQRQSASAWSIDTVAGSVQPKSELPTEPPSAFATPSVASAFGSAASAAFSSGLRQLSALRDANADAGDDAHSTVRPVSAAGYGYFTGLCGLAGCAAPAGNKAAAADGWGMPSGSGGSGLFSPTSEAAWMNLSVATPGAAAATIAAAPRPTTADPQTSGRFQCLRMWPDAEHRSEEEAQDDDEDCVTPTPAMCTSDVWDTADQYGCASPTNLPTPTPANPMTQPVRGPTARQRSRVWHSSKASPQHGPRVLLKPPPIHRSKLYQRRLQHRANSAAKLKLAGGAISQLGPEAKLAAFEQKLGRLKPVASC